MSETYLTPKELGIIIKFSTQAIYNLIHKGTFINGIHYHKPSPKKILFKHSAIQRWIEGNEGIDSEIKIDIIPHIQTFEKKSQHRCINNKEIHSLITI